MLGRPRTPLERELARLRRDRRTLCFVHELEGSASRGHAHLRNLRNRRQAIQGRYARARGQTPAATQAGQVVRQHRARAGGIVDCVNLGKSLSLIEALKDAELFVMLNTPARMFVDWFRREDWQGFALTDSTGADAWACAALERARPVCAA